MSQTVMPSYGRADIAFETGDGPYLYASDGRKFLDFGSGVAVLDIGATQQVQGIYIAGFALYNLATSFDRQGEITLLERLQ